MPRQVGLGIHDLEYVDGVVHAWVEVGIRGLTLIDSRGPTQSLDRGGARDDLPIFPSLPSMLETSSTEDRPLSSVVEDDIEIDRLVRATEAAVGELSRFGTGFLFILPVTRVVGLQPRR